MREVRDEIAPKWMSRAAARRQTECSLTIPRGEHSSIRLMIGLESCCIGEMREKRFGCPASSKGVRSSDSC
jgi:hypothetical protein